MRGSFKLTISSVQKLNISRLDEAPGIREIILEDQGANPEMGALKLDHLCREC